ncbi:hypothetical protein [Peptacetobacter sp. AB800]|uniref:hypothetical protein n=1 Tax=Peptacetobacter sp. AB800 TaxID=3388428 RepID=UPI0039FD0051
MNKPEDLFKLFDRDRTQKKKLVTIFELDEIKYHFDENINSIRDSFEIIKDLKEDNKKMDILRYQIISLDSTIDFYMHEITKYGMNRMYNGYWEKTEKYNNFKIEMSDIHKIMISKQDDIFNEVVNKKYANDTFMTSKSIIDQLKLIGISPKELADNVFYDRNSKENTMDKLKTFLDKLFVRRNLIAHQSDRNHADAEKNSINEDYVKKQIDMVIKFINGIDTLIRNKDEIDR